MLCLEGTVDVFGGDKDDPLLQSSKVKISPEPAADVLAVRDPSPNEAATTSPPTSIPKTVKASEKKNNKKKIRRRTKTIKRTRRRK